MGSILQGNDYGDEYHLPRGGIEALRLAAQHHMLLTKQGWTIHPEIAKSLAEIPHPRIVDVATGTGIWAYELAQQMPHAEVVGLDISDAQFGPQWALPPNLNFDLYDLLTEVPPELVGTFDYVHVRLLINAGPAVDKSVYYDKFRSLLRPGGWLQWDDLAWPNILLCERVSTSASGYRVWGLENEHPWMRDVQIKHLDMVNKATWFPDFERVTASVGGFENATRIQVPLQPYFLQLETDLFLSTCTNIADLLMKRKPKYREEVSHAIKELYTLAENGLKMTYNWHVCIAQKSS